MNRLHLLEESVEAVDEWFALSNTRILAPTDDHWKVLRRLVREGRSTGPLVAGAEPAALTIEHGGVLHTADRDFARYPGLRWTNPLA